MSGRKSADSNTIHKISNNVRNRKTLCVIGLSGGKELKKISWKKRLMLSYIFIGILPLIILGSFFYYGNRMSVRSEVEKSNAAKLSLVLQKMDYITEKMNSVAYHFSNTSTAENLNGVRNKAIDIDEGMIQSQLATYAKIISEEENATRMLLYLRGDTYLYTIEGRMKYLEFETQMQRYGD